MTNLKNRVMDDDGNIVEVHQPRDKKKGLERENEILKQKLKSAEENVKFRRSEIQALKQMLKEQEPLLKQQVTKLQKELAMVRGEVQEYEKKAKGKKSGFLDKKLGRNTMHG